MITRHVPPLSEKSRGKRAAADEPARKKRKMATVAPRKLGGISLGGDQTTCPWRAVVIEWSDDDKNTVPPPPSMQTTSCSTRVEEQPRGSDEVPKQQATKIPVEQAMGVPEHQVELNLMLQVEETPEQQVEQRPTIEGDRPPPENTGVDPTAAPRGSNRPHRFKKVHRQTKR